MCCSAGQGQAANFRAAVLAKPLHPARLLGRARELAAVLEEFPAVQHAFAYGSGVFVQPGLYTAASQAQGPMLDFMFAVDSPEEWHDQANLLLRKDRNIGDRRARSHETFFKRALLPE